MNEPKNKPAAPLGLARRPFAAVARISLLAVLVAVLGACGAQQGGAAGPASPPGPPATEEQAAGNATEDRGETEASASATDAELGNPVLGDEDAPVTMVEYADYQ
ncbi:MAG: hypothetical protein CYG60_05025 [Actinobacteria bacterium]|nr:MAG: hypothetical protein CYG60_05025 [Actinomycetota bacterium]